jgi:Protein of unknown function (DUF4089)
MTDSADLLPYVKASAALHGLPLDEARALRVATHLSLTARLFALLEAAPMGPEDELAEIYRPAPFPKLSD